MNENKLSAGDWFFGKVLRMGASWKTTLGGLGSEVLNLLIVLSVAPYTLPSEITEVIPAKVKGWMLTGSVGAKFVIRLWTWWNTKSKNVTGGDTQQTLSGDIAKPGTQNLVDATVKASIASDDPTVTPEQRIAVQSPPPVVNVEV